jgi:transcription termination/antitermination protein NusG
MPKEWFVLQTLSGQENKARENMLKRVELEEMGDLVEEILVPTEKVSEVKQGKKTTITRKFFPGYILVRMELYGDDRKMVEKSWYFTQQTPGVIGFVGGETPVPLRQSEVDQILNQIEEKKEKVKPKVVFEPGETVKITDGPFVSFSGIIEEVDPDRGKLKVSVSIFGRSAPVELEYWQVEREA